MTNSPFTAFIMSLFVHSFIHSNGILPRRLLRRRHGQIARRGLLRRLDPRPQPGPDVRHAFGLPRPIPDPEHQPVPLRVLDELPHARRLLRTHHVDLLCDLAAVPLQR